MTGYAGGTRMTGTTTEGILEGKPEEEQRKGKQKKMLGCGTNNGWIIDQTGAAVLP